MTGDRKRNTGGEVDWIAEDHALYVEHAADKLRDKGSRLTGNTLDQVATFLREQSRALAEFRAALEDARRLEVLLPVDGYHGSYEISSLGRVRSLDRVDSDGNRRQGAHLVPYRKGKGYVAVTLNSANKKVEKYVHRLVATAFIENPDELPQVNHIDGDPGNNSALNLEWVTNSENQIHARRVLARNVRAVYGISEDGSRIDFQSLQHAVEAGFIRANIQKCIAGVRGRHRGYRWFDAAIDALGRVDGEGA